MALVFFCCRSSTWHQKHNTALHYKPPRTCKNSTDNVWSHLLSSGPAKCVCGLLTVLLWKMWLYHVFLLVFSDSSQRQMQDNANNFSLCSLCFYMFKQINTSDMLECSTTVYKPLSVCYSNAHQCNDCVRPHRTAVTSFVMLLHRSVYFNAQHSSVLSWRIECSVFSPIKHICCCRLNF